MGYRVNKAGTFGVDSFNNQPAAIINAFDDAGASTSCRVLPLYRFSALATLRTLVRRVFPGRGVEEAAHVGGGRRHLVGEVLLGVARLQLLAAVRGQIINRGHLAVGPAVGGAGVLHA